MGDVQTMDLLIQSFGVMTLNVPKIIISNVHGFAALTVKSSIKSNLRNFALHSCI